MNLDLDKINEKLEQNDFIKNFMKEISEALENFKNQNETNGESLENFKNQNEINDEKLDDIKLTQEEDLELYKRQSNFLQEYFNEQLSDLSKGEIFLVTNKYENDFEYHRYKVTQYINNHERKYIAFEKDLPENVQIGDVIRKIDGKYIYDEQATIFVNDTINELKREIIERRTK